MNEDVHAKIAALNAVWQRYAEIAEESLDPATAEALNQEYLTARERLDACGVAEWMLEYDPGTLTFSLPTTGTFVDHQTPTIIGVSSRWRKSDLDTESRQLLS